MNRQDFIKYTALGSTATILIPSELEAFNIDTNVDKWYYGRSLYSSIRKNQPDKVFYKYNSMLFKITKEPYELKVQHEVLIADQEKEFPLGSFVIYRTEYDYKQKEGKRNVFTRKGSKKEAKLLTMRSFPYRSLSKMDMMFLHPETIDLSQLGKNGNKKITISDAVKSDFFYISGHFDKNTETFINFIKDGVVAPYSHRNSNWIKLDERQHQQEIKKYFTTHKIDVQPVGDLVAFSENSDGITDASEAITPKRKSFLDTYKKKQGIKDEQRDASIKRLRRKYKVSEYKPEHKFYIILEITLSGALRKGDIIEFDYAHSKYEVVTEEAGQWKKRYKLLDDLTPEKTIHLQNVSDNYNSFIDKFESIKCYTREEGRFKNTYMLLTYSGGKKVTLKAQIW